MRGKPASLFICAGRTPLANALDRSGGLLLEGARIPGTWSMPRSPLSRLPRDRAIARPAITISTTYQKGTSIMRRRPIIRKAVKTALIAKAVQRLGRRAEKQLKKH
jgi:hypothetical protein